VGPGNVLGDLIRSRSVATFHLREVFRQAQDSGIVRAAHAINAGEHPDFDHARDCRMIEADAPADILKAVETFLKSHREFDPIRDVQILTPMNKGELGTQQLNVMLQTLLNPQGKSLIQREAFQLRAGDKVIQNSNNYELGVFNGDIGVVMDSGVDRGSVVVNFAGRIVKYADEYTQDLRLAYAITIHKSQGSEFPVVLIPISMQHFIMLQRNLIYTALTRAKKLAVFFGTKKALGYAARNVKQNMRQTRLHRRLKPAGDQPHYVQDHALD
jgi:exodeoxyribonuclease V alpha subunit